MNRIYPSGEILRGHAGTYRTFSYPAGALSPAEENRCLENTLPGDRTRGNQTLRTVACKGKVLLVTGYSVMQRRSAVEAVFQHAAYFQDYTMSHAGCSPEDVVQFLFADETDFLQVANRKYPFGPQWVRHGADLDAGWFPFSLPAQQQADLACCCLSKGMTNDFGSLAVEIPSGGDYLCYCRSLMLMILRCVPRGLWRYLSFATNPDDAGRKNTVVTFVPEHTPMRAAGQTVLRLDGSPWPIGSIRSEIQALITRAAADPKILDIVANEVECNVPPEELSVEQYVNFWRQYELRCRPLDAAMLQDYVKQLEKSLDSRTRQRLEREIQSRLAGDGVLESALAQDQALMRALTPEDLDQALAVYQPIFRLLNRKLNDQLSVQLIRNLLSVSIQNPSLENLIACESALNRCANAASNGMLDSDMVKEARGSIWQEKQRINQERKAAFEQVLATSSNISDWKQSLETLAPCEPDIRSACLAELVQKQLEILEQTKSSESATKDNYQKYLELLGSAPEGEPLKQWYREWERHLNERKQLLNSLNSYRDLLKVVPPDEECLRALHSHFSKAGWQHAGVIDFLQAAELIWGKSWFNLTTELDTLPARLQKARLLGVCLGQGKSWVSLYSELLACQDLIYGSDDPLIQVWYKTKESWSACSVPLDRFIASVKAILPVVLDNADPSTLPEQDHLRMFIRSGMMSSKEGKRFGHKSVAEQPENDKKPEQKVVHKASGPNVLSFFRPWMMIVLCAVVLFIGIVVGIVLLVRGLNGPASEPAMDQDPSSVSTVEPIQPSVTATPFPQQSTAEDSVSEEFGSEEFGAENSFAEDPVTENPDNEDFQTEPPYSGSSSGYDPQTDADGSDDWAPAPQFSDDSNFLS